MSQREIFEGLDLKALPRPEEAPPDEPALVCLCPGCPEMVPTSWESGMCGPCLNERCEHADPDGESW